MTEEVKKEEVQQTEQHEFSPVEQEALAQGWAPKEEFTGDPAKWVDAGEFVRRGELFKKIDQVTRENKQTKQALAQFKEHYVKVKESEYQRALADLKREYKLANREGDFDKADAIEQQMESVEKEKATFVKEQEQVQTETVPHPEFAAWVARNSWYATEAHMKVFADKVGIALAQNGMPPEQVLKKVDEAVRKEFPTKFKNPNQERPGAVEGSSTRGSKSKDTFELSEQERVVMNNLVNSKVMTKEEYIADLKKLKGVA